MKAGDKFVCIKEFISFSGTMLFTVGKIYYISDIDIDNDKIFFSSNISQLGNYWFLITNNEHEFYHGNFFKNYIQYERLNKLRKINESRR
jgi:hypothetical protein